MILNSKFTYFYFRFPNGWFYPQIVEKYDIFFKKQKNIYTNLEDYMSFSLQSFEWPPISPDLPQQAFNQVTKFYKTGWNAERHFEQSFTLTFKVTEGFLSYFIMLEQFLEYWRLKENDEVFLPDLYLLLLDHNGYANLQVVFSDIVFQSISNLTLSYANILPEFQMFTAIFRFKKIKIKVLDFLKDVPVDLDYA